MDLIDLDCPPKIYYYLLWIESEGQDINSAKKVYSLSHFLCEAKELVMIYYGKQHKNENVTVKVAIVNENWQIPDNPEIYEVVFDIYYEPDFSVHSFRKVSP